MKLRRKGERGRRKVSSYRFFFTKRNEISGKMTGFVEKVNQGKKQTFPIGQIHDYIKADIRKSKKRGCTRIETKASDVSSSLAKDDEGLKLNSTSRIK